MLAIFNFISTRVNDCTVYPPTYIALETVQSPQTLIRILYTCTYKRVIVCTSVNDFCLSTLYSVQCSTQFSISYQKNNFFYEKKKSYYCEGKKKYP